MKILLIAGHGGNDPGAQAFNRSEADLARELTHSIKTSLSRFDCKVDVFDTSKSAYHEIIRSGKVFDFTKYQYVLEVHFNAFKENSDGKVTGSEIYVTTSEGIITVEKAILEKLSALGFKNRGVKRKNFSVIAEARSQGVSSALLEVCFIDDADDMKIYNPSSCSTAIADAIAEGYKLSEVKRMYTDINYHWAREAIEKVSAMGIMGGFTDRSFKPDSPLTRSEAATIAVRILERCKK